MHKTVSALLVLAGLFGLIGPAHAITQCGKASWYAMTSRTASGERASPATMTAAHRTLPLGTKVRVTNLRNGRSVVVRINDRGPFVRGRVIDVTKAVATKLGFRRAGWTHVGLSTKGKRFHRGRCETVADNASLLPMRPALPAARPPQHWDDFDIAMNDPR